MLDRTEPSSALAWSVDKNCSGGFGSITNHFTLAHVILNRCSGRYRTLIPSSQGNVIPLRSRGTLGTLLFNGG